MSIAVQTKMYSNSGNKSILQMIPEDISNVLDVGCGAGDNAKKLYLKGINVDGITLSEIEAIRAKAYCTNVYIHDLEMGLPVQVQNKNYEACICSHVLEHICWPEKLLADIKKVLSPSGVLIVALPNLLHYKSRIELLKGNFNYAPSGIWDNTHFRWYTFKTGRDLLEKNGFEIIEAKTSGSLPYKSLLEKIFTDNLQNSITSLLNKKLPGIFGSQLLYKVK